MGKSLDAIILLKPIQYLQQKCILLNINQIQDILILFLGCTLIARTRNKQDINWKNVIRLCYKSWIFQAGIHVISVCGTVSDLLKSEICFGFNIQMVDKL